MNMGLQREPIPDELNAISGDIVDCALKVHRALGPGLLESVYETCLALELRKLSHHVDLQVPLGLQYEGESIEMGFRLDMLVDGRVVVEIKSVGKMHPLYRAQVLTYLRAGGFRLGLLINFNVPFIKDGIERLAN